MKRRHLVAAVVVVGAVIWLDMHSLDGIPGILLLRLLGDDTRYAAGYTDRGFRAVHTGLTESEVRALLGPPLGEMWRYDNGSTCDFVYVRGGEVDTIVLDDCRAKGIRAHMPVKDVVRLLGSSHHVAWRYTESPRSTHYRERVICFRDGLVSDLRSGVYLD
jgi:hypothetical protein